MAGHVGDQVTKACSFSLEFPLPLSLGSLILGEAGCWVVSSPMERPTGQNTDVSNSQPGSRSPTIP